MAIITITAHFYTKTISNVVNTHQIASSQTAYRIGLIGWNIWWEVNKKEILYCVGEECLGSLFRKEIYIFN